jgi:hypothetical protein
MVTHKYENYQMKRPLVPLVLLLSLLVGNPVWPQEIKSPLHNDLGQTYGYYSGQKLSIEWIQREFPALSARASQAQMAFELVFKASYSNIENELRKLLGQQWPAFKRQMLQGLENNLVSAPISITQADTFIRTVRLRAKGQIETPVLETLLTYNPQFQKKPAKEFLRGFKSTFRTKGHSKAKGVNFQIEYPRSWSSKEGKRPNVIKVFTSQNGRGQETILLMVKDIPLPSGYKITEQELDSLFSPQGLKEMIPKGASFISAQPIVLDGKKGGMMVFDQTLQRLDVILALRGRFFITIHANKMIFIQCMVISKIGNQAGLNQQFRRLEPLFRLVANSFVIQSQY